MIIITLLFVLFLVGRSFRRYRRLFNPFTLSIQVPLLFILLPQTVLVALGLGEDSVLSDIVTLVYCISIYIGSLCVLAPVKIPSFRNNGLIKSSIIILILIFAIPTLPMLLQHGLSFRGLRLFYEEIVFSQYASFYEIIKVLLSILLIIFFIKDRRITFRVVLVTLILFFTGSKMAILSTFVLLVTLWEEYKTVNYKFLLFISILLGVGMIFYHFTQSLYNDRGILMTALSYFDVYKNQTMALDMFVSGKLDYYYGRLSFSSIYRIIPRIIWADKPVAYSFALLNYDVFPEYASAGYMPSMGLAYNFADFGFLSLIASGLFSGFLKNYFYHSWKHNKNNVPSAILYLMGLNIITMIMFVCFYIITKIKKYDTQDYSLLLVKRR